MKMKLFLLLACTFILGACGSTPHTLVPSYVKLKPLSQEDLVRIVDATEVPVALFRIALREKAPVKFWTAI